MSPLGVVSRPACVELLMVYAVICPSWMSSSPIWRYPVLEAWIGRRAQC